MFRLHQIIMLLCGLYIATFTATAFCEPTRFVATQINTTLLQEIQFTARHTNLHGELFFTAHDSVGSQIFKTDGRSVVRIEEGVEARSFFYNSGDHLLFQGTDANGVGLFSIDGEQATRLASLEMTVPTEHGVIGPSFTAVNDRVFFPANGPNGWELYQTDGVTVEHFDINPTGDSSPRHVATLDNLYFFTADSGDGEKFYRTDGANIMDLGSPPKHSVAVEFQNELFYSNKQNTLVRTDGVSIVDVNGVGGRDLTGISPRNLFPLDRSMFFIGNGEEGFQELYITDGVTATEIDSHHRAGGQDVRLLFGIGDILFFRGKGPINRDALVRTDGAEFDEIMLFSGIGGPGRGPYDRDQFIRHDGHVHFRGRSRFHVDEGFRAGLFKTNGQTASYVDLGSGDYEPGKIYVVGDTLFFTVVKEDETHYYQLDGQTARSIELDTVDVGPPSRINHIGGELFIEAQGANGNDVYHVDGTTITGYDVNPGQEATVRLVANIGSDFYFAESSNLFKLTPAGSCDVDSDGNCNFADIDALMSAIADGHANTSFDLNRDGLVSELDRDEWLAQAGPRNGFAEPFLVGDANLDGVVNVLDLNELGTSWLSGNNLWSRGNFVGAESNAQDLNALGLNWEQQIGRVEAQPVPESSGFVCAIGLAGMLMLSRKRF